MALRKIKFPKKTGRISVPKALEVARAVYQETSAAPKRAARKGSARPITAAETATGSGRIAFHIPGVTDRRPRHVRRAPKAGR